jgi:hypothetical protein
MPTRRYLAAALLAIGTGAAGMATAATPAHEAHAKGRILVMPRAGLSDADFGKILGAHGGKARRIGKSRLYIVDLPAGASEQAVAAQLARHPQLKFAEVDRRMSITFTPNDPYLGSEWHTNQIGAPAAWNLAQGAGVTIAILDTGVDGTHPDLAGQMVAGWDYYDNSANTSDVQGHGTAVAGAAAATINNGVGVASIAGQAKIMPIRVTDPSGNAYASTIAQGITYAADHGARVANISISGVAASSTTLNAAQYMKNLGGLVVVAAGNDGINENIAATTTMIPVSATDSNDALTSWSSYGNYIALAAPGLNIWTTQSGGSYWSCWGTSFSSPITAGVVALMMSAKPSLPNTQIESLLYSTAVDLGAPGRDIYYGYGRVNAGAAVQAAASTVSNVDTQPPSASISAPLGSASVSGLVPVNVTASDNVGVTKVELRVNGSTVATDTATPFAFSWNSTTLANGSATLVAVAYDAAGNSAASAPVSVTVANASTLSVAISKPANGSAVSGVVGVSTKAVESGNASTVKQSLYIDGSLKTTGSGTSLAYNWNTKKAASGAHTINVVATDASGNTSSNSVQVTTK